ncbi:MAG: hypothetical protein HUJ71_08015 [Pseudobutyrivibrio sp.]|nr:hypothetical protein [Pseudobutyrivibrio sp.]
MKRLFRFLFRSLFILCVVLGVAVFLDFDISGLHFDNFSPKELTEAENTEDVKEWYYQQVGNVVVGEPEKVTSISYDRYAYQQLNDETRQVYDQVLDTILGHKEKVVLLTKDADVLDTAFNCVKADYGGLFWVNGYVYNTYTQGDAIISLEFVPSYTMTKEQRDDIQQRIDDTVEQWMVGISFTDSDYDKVKYVFETLINNVEYDTNSEDNQNIVSVFLNQRTVCQGYSDAAWYMLEELGVPCTVITGNAHGEPHAWNLVKMDGNYYYMDVTWGNSRYLSTDSMEEKHVNYAYMSMTTDELLATHELDTDFIVPNCFASEDNYFVKESRYFDSWDVGGIGYTLGDSWDLLEDEISLKFSDTALMNQTVQYFITDMHLTDFCWEIRNVSYITDDNVNVLTFQWKH